MDGGTWELVRRVKPGNQWHPSTDNLQGTDVYGVFVNDITVDSTFSIAFNVAEVEDFLFITGDQQKWVIASVEAVLGARDETSGNFLGYSGQNRDIKMSSISPDPYQALWYNRISVAEDPWISLTDHSLAVEEGNIIYGEAEFNLASHTSILRLHNGANVYIRRKGIFFYQNEIFIVSLFISINLGLGN